jgi:hypothetical protein
VRILVTGKGGSAGSWQIRGEQLGAAIGAEVMPLAEMAEIRSADVVVVVKRTPADLIRKVRAAGRPWVWDIVDGWPQPYGNEWPEETAVRWLRQQVAELGPTAMVFPTHRMREDSGFLGPSLVLPHHAWPKYRAAPVAPRVERVGYEGAEAYLGKWLKPLQAACAARGWAFVVNGDLASCQIGVALRSATGYPCGAWKANTKLANLQALGLPAIVSPEMGYRETASGSEVEVTSPAVLGIALDTLADHGVRLAISERAQRAAPRLEQVARVYRAWLCASKY